jgi:hypothetical protein
MNSIKPSLTIFHAPAVLKRLLGALLAVLLLGALTAIPALASGSGTWKTTGSLNVSRYNDTATLLQNGQVLVAGGTYDYNYDATASSELYTPSTGKWTTTGSMNSPRQYHTATLLQNGQVLVAAGSAGLNAYGYFTPLASAELYNPSTGKWTTTGSMNVARYQDTATLLQNGQVLVVAGGSTDKSGYTASAELYTPSTGKWTTTGSLIVARYGFLTETVLQNG